MPSWRACHQVPRTPVIPVPGGGVQRQRAKRVPETVPWPSRVKLLTWAPANGSPPARHAEASGRNLAPPVVSAQLGVGADVPAALRDRVLAGLAPSRRRQQHQASASTTPSATPRPTPPLVPVIVPPSLDCVPEGLRRGRGKLSPLRRRPRDGRLCENRANGTSHARSDHREAARRHRPRAAALDRRAGHGPLDRGPGGRPRRGRRLADHRRLPDPLPLRTGRRPAGLPARRRDRASASASTSSPTRRKAPCSRRSAAASCRRARWPRSRT